MWLFTLQKAESGYREHLEHIQGSGYFVDLRCGKAICPRCDSGGHRSIMRIIDWGATNDIRLHCMDCGETIPLGSGKNIGDNWGRRVICSANIPSGQKGE